MEWVRCTFCLPSGGVEARRPWKRIALGDSLFEKQPKGSVEHPRTVEGKSVERNASAAPVAPVARAIPLSFIFLVAVAVHLPLLLMELPLKTYDTNFHIFFASHYLHHWFDPWNPKWYAGFSQTTYPPLPQQWLAVVSNVMGLDMAYMAVQFVGILLLVLGVYRFSLLWVDPRAAALAALASVFLGSESFLIYSAGQLSTTCAAPLYLNALPYLFEWVRYGKGRSFLKGAALSVAAAAAHHATLLFGSLFFALPVLALVVLDGQKSARRDRDNARGEGNLFRFQHLSYARSAWRWWWESAWRWCCCPSGLR